VSGGTLNRSVKGCADLEPAVKTELARLTLPDETLVRQAEASKALAALEKKMLADEPFEDANVRALTKPAEKHAGTKAAARAARLAQLARIEF
jgi:hypothetical protein